MSLRRAGDASRRNVGNAGRASLARIDTYVPAKGEWTMFDLPTRGTEIRHISLLEKDGMTRVTVPIYRDSKMGVMTLRGEADVAALKAKVK